MLSRREWLNIYERGEIHKMKICLKSMLISTLPGLFLTASAQGSNEPLPLSNNQVAENVAADLAAQVNSLSIISQQAPAQSMGLSPDIVWLLVSALTLSGVICLISEILAESRSGKPTRVADASGAASHVSTTHRAPGQQDGSASLNVKPRSHARAA